MREDANLVPFDKPDRRINPSAIVGPDDGMDTLFSQECPGMLRLVPVAILRRNFHSGIPWIGSVGVCCVPLGRGLGVFIK